MGFEKTWKDREVNVIRVHDVILPENQLKRYVLKNTHTLTQS